MTNLYLKREELRQQNMQFLRAEHTEPWTEYWGYTRGNSGLPHHAATLVHMGQDQWSIVDFGHKETKE